MPAGLSRLHAGLHRRLTRELLGRRWHARRHDAIRFVVVVDDDVGHHDLRLRPGVERGRRRRHRGRPARRHDQDAVERRGADRSRARLGDVAAGGAQQRFERAAFGDVVQFERDRSDRSVARRRRPSSGRRVPTRRESAESRRPAPRSSRVRWRSTGADRQRRPPPARRSVENRTSPSFFIRVTLTPSFSIRLIGRRGERSGWTAAAAGELGAPTAKRLRRSSYRSFVIQSGESFFGRSHDRQMSGPPLSRCWRRASR